MGRYCAIVPSNIILMLAALWQGDICIHSDWPCSRQGEGRGLGVGLAGREGVGIWQTLTYWQGTHKGQEG